MASSNCRCQVVPIGPVEAPPANARKRARRAALVASGYGVKRSKGEQARRKVKANRLHVSRRTRRRHRRQRRAA
ncbi:hypothetical protein ACFOKF_15435 [Sphingobium rhizovicinum]|uniref:Uncharacterized protein n=1 Tax=Sphingobium rhizovicinum TaxID=432308 RepID=A0ABV7NID3_9SPHN